MTLKKFWKITNAIAKDQCSRTPKCAIYRTMSGKNVSMSRWDCIFSDAMSSRKVLHCRIYRYHYFPSHPPMNGNAPQRLLLLHYNQMCISIWMETTRSCAHIQYPLRKICIINSRMELKIEFLIKMYKFQLGRWTGTIDGVVQRRKII